MNILYIVLGVILLSVIINALGNKIVPLPTEKISDDDIIRLASEGKKIQAIKWYRTLHEVGLKDAKEAVEKLTEANS